MERRKFLIGMGAVTAGGTAALGTGAFSQARANRGVNPHFADDADAYMALEPCDSPNGEHVETNKQGVARVNFDGITSVGGQGQGPNDGQGLNKNATTILNEVLAIRNQGTQTYDVTLSDPDSSDDLTVLSPDSINNGSTFSSDGVYASLARDGSGLVQGNAICVDFAVKSTSGSGLPTGTRQLEIWATGDDS